MAKRVQPISSLTFQFRSSDAEDNIITASESLAEDSSGEWSSDPGIEAWEGLPFESLPISPTQIDYDFEADGNQPPGLDIDPALGVISGTVDEFIFKSLIQAFAEQKVQGSVTVDLGPDEEPSPYLIGNQDPIHREYVFIVSGWEQVSGSPDIYHEETWAMRVGKNFDLDPDDFDFKSLYEDS